MAFQLSQVAIFTALLYFSYCGVIFGKNTQNSQHTKPTKHGEVHRAKSEIDSLIYKLSLVLNNFNEKKTVAAVMLKDAENVVRVAKEEIAVLKTVRHLLETLAKGNTSSEYQRCMPRPRSRPGGEIPVRIKATVSPLPKDYTISISGMKLCFVF